MRRRSRLQILVYALARGLTSVELHVLSHNAVAQALYRSLGYGVTGFHMLKPLRRDEA